MILMKPKQSVTVAPGVTLKNLTPGVDAKKTLEESGNLKAEFRNVWLAKHIILSAETANTLNPPLHISTLTNDAAVR